MLAAAQIEDLRTDSMLTSEALTLMPCPRCAYVSPESADFNYCPRCGMPLRPSVGAATATSVSGGVAVTGDTTVGGSMAGRDITNITQHYHAMGGLGADVPLMNYSYELKPIEASGITDPGIQFTDRPREDKDTPPFLYLSVYFKRSPLFTTNLPRLGQKWLYIQADMRPALNVRLQVSVSNDYELDEFMKCLGGQRDDWTLQERRTDLGGVSAGPDYLYIWRENGETRLMISTFTETAAGISIHAKMSPDVVAALVKYLNSVGFAKPFRPSTFAQPHSPPDEGGQRMGTG